MKKREPTPGRIDELRAMLAAYREMTIEEVEDSDWGDVQVEIEAEVWQLEQELYDVHRRLHAA